jgi:ABC-type sugar transport system substrate-binding protein
MKNRKKAVTLILTALMLVAFTLLSGCSSNSAPAGTNNKPAGDAPAKVGKDIKQPLKIAYIPLSTSGVACSLEIKAMTDQLLTYPNVKFQVFDPQFDPSKQVTMIQECVTQ